jgi:hypothetical protein
MDYKSKAMLGKIINALRRVSRSCSAIKSAENRQKRGPAIYECEHCKAYCYVGKSKVKYEQARMFFVDKVVKFENVARDHVEPVIDPANPSYDLNVIVQRMMPEDTKEPPHPIQILCKSCHNIKTQEENKIRKATSKATGRKIAQKRRLGKNGRKSSKPKTEG